MGLIRSGMYIGAATYIIKKITDDKQKDKSNNANPQNTQYPPPGPYPQQYQDNRGYPPQYQQYPTSSQQQPNFGNHEAQYQGPPPVQYGREERGMMESRPYQPQESFGREKASKIEDAPMPRQWEDAQPSKSRKW